MPDLNPGMRKEQLIFFLSFFFLKERDVLLITREMEFSLTALVPALIPMLADCKGPSLCELSRNVKS